MSKMESYALNLLTLSSNQSLSRTYEWGRSIIHGYRPQWLLALIISWHLARFLKATHFSRIGNLTQQACHILDQLNKLPLRNWTFFKEMLSYNCKIWHSWLSYINLIMLPLLLGSGYMTSGASGALGGCLTCLTTLSSIKTGECRSSPVDEDWELTVDWDRAESCCAPGGGTRGGSWFGFLGLGRGDWLCLVGSISNF